MQMNKRGVEMAQLDRGLNLSTKHTGKQEFFDGMWCVVPWLRLIALVEPYHPKGGTGRPPFPVATMLQIHFMQQRFRLSDPAMEEALYDMSLYREFAGLDGSVTRLPDETTIRRCRHLLETHGPAGQTLAVVNEIVREKGPMLEAGSVVDAMLIAALSFTRNESVHGPGNVPDAERRQLVLWHQAAIRRGCGVGAGAHRDQHGGDVQDSNTAHALLRGEGKDVYANDGCQDTEKVTLI